MSERKRHERTRRNQGWWKQGRQGRAERTEYRVTANTTDNELLAGLTGEVFNAGGRVGFAIPAQGIEGAICFEIDAIHPAGVPAGNPGWVQVLIAGSGYCRINPDLCRPPYHRLADCVMIAHLHRGRLPLGGGSAIMRVLPPAPHPEAQEILFWRVRLLDGEVVMVDTPERVRRLGGRV